MVTVLMLFLVLALLTLLVTIIFSTRFASYRVAASDWLRLFLYPADT